MGKNLFGCFAFRKLFFSDVDFGQKRQLARKQPSLAKTVAGTKNGTVSRERRPEYNHCFHRARRLWRAGIRVRVRPAYILGRAKSRSGPGGSIVAVVVAYKSLLRKDLTRSYRADSAVRRPHECAQSPVAESRMLSTSSESEAGLLSSPGTARRGGIQRELPSIITNGQEAGKIFQRKMFHVLTVFSASFGVSCSTPSVCASPLRSKDQITLKGILSDAANQQTTCFRTRPDRRNTGRFGRT
jgi:hypothetical protein